MSVSEKRDVKLEGNPPKKSKFNFQNGVFIGSINSSGEPDGFGKCVYRSGNVYKGNWKNAYQSGEGVFTFTNSDRYQGSFVKGEMTGRGVLTFATGDIYRGQFLRGEFHGKGEFFFQKSGDRWRGNWVNDEMAGEGAWMLGDGKGNIVKSYDGKMENDKFLADQLLNRETMFIEKKEEKEVSPSSPKKASFMQFLETGPIIPPFKLEDAVREHASNTPETSQEVLKFDGDVPTPIKSIKGPKKVSPPIPIEKRRKDMLRNETIGNTPPTISEVTPLGNLLFFSPETPLVEAIPLTEQIENTSGMSTETETMDSDSILSNRSSRRSSTSSDFEDIVASIPTPVKGVGDVDFPPMPIVTPEVLSRSPQLADLLNSSDISISNIKQNTVFDTILGTVAPVKGDVKDLNDLLSSPDMKKESHASVSTPKSIPSPTDNILDIPLVPELIVPVAVPIASPTTPTKKKTDVSEGELISLPKSPHKEKTNEERNVGKLFDFPMVKTPKKDEQEVSVGQLISLATPVPKKSAPLHLRVETGGRSKEPQKKKKPSPKEGKLRERNDKLPAIKKPKAIKKIQKDKRGTGHTRSLTGASPPVDKMIEDLFNVPPNGDLRTMSLPAGLRPGMFVKSGSMSDVLQDPPIAQDLFGAGKESGVKGKGNLPPPLDSSLSVPNFLEVESYGESPKILDFRKKIERYQSKIAACQENIKFLEKKNT